MQNQKTIRTALISVYHKDNLEPIIRKLHALNVHLFSTGGTQKFINDLGIPVTGVDELTEYPAILDGRVKTLHPKVFGGILARREFTHLVELDQLDIPEIDLVIVDLYPFEQTVATTDDESEIIEKIDIGGISLIRAAAKNFKDVVIIPSRADYHHLLELLETRNGATFEIERRQLARRAFSVSADYDEAIFNYFDDFLGSDQADLENSVALRYGENPHQNAVFYGDLEDVFEQLHGKPLSYNNLVDVDAAINLVHEFRSANPTFAIIKHTNACGLATRPTILEAWKAALACDTTSAFGGVLCSNTPIDAATAAEIDQLFFEIIIAPAFDDAAIELLSKKKNRIILQQHDDFQPSPKHYKSLLNGTIEQDADLKTENIAAFSTLTTRKPTETELHDLCFANICAKHLKSNTIALVRNAQLIGMGCGQTSRVDALQQAIHKAKSFGFDLNDAVMASDAFFPFADCVTIAHEAGVTAVVHPGGSIRDKDSIDFCDEKGMAMVTTGTRHFKH